MFNCQRWSFSTYNIQRCGPIFFCILVYSLLRTQTQIYQSLFLGKITMEAWWTRHKYGSLRVRLIPTLLRISTQQQSRIPGVHIFLYVAVSGTSLEWEREAFVRCPGEWRWICLPIVLNRSRTETQWWKQPELPKVWDFKDPFVFTVLKPDCDLWSMLLKPLMKKEKIQCEA